MHIFMMPMLIFKTVKLLPVVCCFFFFFKGNILQRGSEIFSVLVAFV